MMGPVPTDAEAIEASRSDPPRFAVVFDRHFASLHRYLRRRVGKDLADELAAEAFARAFAGRNRYDTTTHPDARPWLFGIASNLLRRHARTERRRLVAYARTGVDPISSASEVEDAAGRLDAKAAGPRIAAALATLGAGQREVLLLFAWAELSYEEIGRALRVPVGTVRSRLSRARSRMRELLAGFGQGQGDGSPDPQPSEEVRTVERD
jgi:RNA polymerase sigma factor (sigma-70 family)